MSNLGSRNKGQGTIDRQTRRQGTTQEIEQPVIEEPVEEALISMSMSKAELVEMAEALDISTKGTKQDIIDRLTV